MSRESTISRLAMLFAARPGRAGIARFWSRQAPAAASGSGRIRFRQAISLRRPALRPSWAALLSRAVCLSVVPSVLAADATALDGGTLRLDTYGGWKAFEVVTQGDDPPDDGFAYAMLGAFDGVGAWLVDPSTLRLQVNHETGDAAVSEVDLDVAALQAAIASTLGSGSTGGVGFVLAARQAYDRWSSDGGGSWIATSDTSNTSFSRFCSGQSYAPHPFGADRGFVDEVYITGEEVAGGRLFAIDSANRDLYQISGAAGSAPGGTGGMPFDAWENAALLDTGETGHVALLLSPDGGSQTLQLFIGEKGRDASGAASNGFLARNGLAFGSWYYLNATYPTLGSTNGGTFDTSAAGALSSDKLEDVDTSPADPGRAVLGDQTSGVFTFDFHLVFGAGFDAGASSFTITQIADTGGGLGSLNGPDNVDWTAPTTLGGTNHPDGLIFVNEDNSSGEIWHMSPDGTDQTLVASTTVGAESTGILDVSELLGYVPASILITNNQGFPASMSVLISPAATPAPPAAVPVLSWVGRVLLALLLLATGRLAPRRPRGRERSLRGLDRRGGPQAPAPRVHARRRVC